MLSTRRSRVADSAATVALLDQARAEVRAVTQVLAAMAGVVGSLSDIEQAVARINETQALISGGSTSRR